MGLGWAVCSLQGSLPTLRRAEAVRQEEAMLVESSGTAPDLDAHDLRHLRFWKHRVERVRLGPAVYWRVDSVRNGSPRVDGSFGQVRIYAQV
jgi:hypothetical protein